MSSIDELSLQTEASRLLLSECTRCGGFLTREMYPEWRVLLSICICSNFINRTCQSFPNFQSSSPRSPKHWYKDVLRSSSVSNGSGLSLRVRVRVETKPLPNWLSGLSTNPNYQLSYVLMVNSQPVWIGQVERAGRPAGPSIDSYKPLVLEFVNSIVS
jgi:hypothetical protein